MSTQYPRTIAISVWLTSHAAQVEPVITAAIAAWPAIAAAVSPVVSAVKGALPPAVQLAIRAATMAAGGRP
jgi:hypothetical protein